MTYEQQKKKDFVRGVSTAVVPFQQNVKDIEYHIFQHVNCEKVVREYLIIHYEGDAFSCTNCTGNSCSAILWEIANHLNSGDYREIPAYLAMKESKEWKEVI